MNRETQLRHLRLLVAQMLDFLEEDITVDRDLPERQELFDYLKRYRIELKNKDFKHVDTDEKGKIIDPTGIELTPGDPEHCKGNGKKDPMTCCCDECSYFLECFPEWAPGGAAWKKGLNDDVSIAK